MFICGNWKGYLGHTKSIVKMGNRSTRMAGGHLVYLAKATYIYIFVVTTWPYTTYRNMWYQYSLLIIIRNPNL